MKENAVFCALRRAVCITLPCLLLCLLICTLLLGSGARALSPLWLVLLFSSVCFVLPRLPFLAEKPLFRFVLCFVGAVALVIFLRMT